MVGSYRLIIDDSYKEDENQHHKWIFILRISH